MQQHIEVFNPDWITPCGLVKICNIEEVWLNEGTDSVAIRYRSPNGNLVDHEEYFDCLRTARLRYATIKNDVLGNPHARFELTFIESLKTRKKEMEACK